jgi:hypothetical protein
VDVGSRGAKGTFYARARVASRNLDAESVIVSCERERERERDRERTPERCGFISLRRIDANGTLITENVTEKLLRRPPAVDIAFLQIASNCAAHCGCLCFSSFSLCRLFYLTVHPDVTYGTVTFCMRNVHACGLTAWLTWCRETKKQANHAAAQKANSFLYSQAHRLFAHQSNVRKRIPCKRKFRWWRLFYPFYMQEKVSSAILKKCNDEYVLAYEQLKDNYKQKFKDLRNWLHWIQFNSISSLVCLVRSIYIFALLKYVNRF